MCCSCSCAAKHLQAHVNQAEVNRGSSPHAGPQAQGIDETGQRPSAKVPSCACLCKMANLFIGSCSRWDVPLCWGSA